MENECPKHSVWRTLSFIRTLISKSLQCAMCLPPMQLFRKAKDKGTGTRHRKDMGHLISPPTLTNIILRVTCYFKCLFLIKKILEFLPTSSFDRGPGEDGVEAWKLSYAGCGKGPSEKDELYSVWSFPSCCLSKAEDHCLRNPHTGRLLCPPNPLPPFPQPRKGLPFIKASFIKC